MSRLNLLESNFEENVNKIWWRCWILISEGWEENGSIVGGLGGQLFWEAQVLGSCMGWKLNTIWLKLRILGLIMKMKNFLMYVKMKINANNAYLCALFVGAPYCDEEKSKKMSLRILPKCWCVSIVVMLRNEFGDGIAVDTGWMLWRHSNTINGKNIVCVCGELWRVW